jgi:hypothetical protein
MLLHKLRHVEANQRAFAAEEKLRERPRHFRFSDTGWTKKQERTDRAQRVLQTGTRTPDGASEC